MNSKKVARVIWWIAGITVLTATVALGIVFGQDTAIGSALGGVVAVWQFFANSLDKIILTFFYIILFMILNVIIRKVTFLLVAKKKHKSKNSAFKTLLTSLVKYIVIIVMLIVIMQLWGVDAWTLVGGMAVFALVIGLGMQQMIADILAGLFLIFEKTFELEDIVVIDNFTGKVIEIGIRNTKLLNEAGDTKTVANSTIRTVIKKAKVVEEIVDKPYEKEKVKRGKKAGKDNGTGMDTKVIASESSAAKTATIEAKASESTAAKTDTHEIVADSTMTKGKDTKVE